MFIGHFAIGFAAKKLAPKSNLAINFMACQLLDLIWPVLVLAGVEIVQVEPGATEFTPLNFVYYPFSHSLIMSLVWSLIFGLGVLMLRRDLKLAAIMGLVVLSHWGLDWIVHRPDLPLMFNGPKVGLGLWNSRPATLFIEGLLFIAGVLMYTRATRRPTKKAKWIFGSLLSFLILIYLVNAFGPVPEIGTPPAAIAGPALAMWLIVLWAAAVERSSNLAPEKRN